ncbi:MAG: hypothetical protein Q9183_007974, partial [Haloplaca sp. 2 TL-2023]
LSSPDGRNAYTIGRWRAGTIRLSFPYYEPKFADDTQCDTLHWYREWVIKEGFAVIDVNFPNHIDSANVSSHTDTHLPLAADLSKASNGLDYDKGLERAQFAAERAELAVYIWENYIEFATPRLSPDAHFMS